MHMQVIEIVCNPVRTAYNMVKASTNYEVQMYGDRLNVAVNNYEQDYPIIKDLFEKTR